MSPVFGHGRLRLYLLKLLDEAPRHGYEVIRLLQDRFMGVYAPSPGTIYPRLARLEEEGLLTHDEEDGRKIYRITDKGREEINRRLDELDELEREITESVSDIAREVKEDVRETVRSLREELTWATRDVHREPARPAREQARKARDEARERTRQLREEVRQARDATGEREDGGAGAEGGPGGEWGGWRGWGGRAGWQDWAGWTDWPGRRRPGPGMSSEFENLTALAGEFGNELRRAMRKAGALGEGALDELRAILEDALERIRTEVFGPPKQHPPESERATDTAAGESASAGDRGEAAEGSGAAGEPEPSTSNAGQPSDAGGPGQPRNATQGDGAPAP
jgi:DNA-binding PadR family transcriptional regulator